MKKINKGMIILGFLFLALTGCTHADYIPVPGPAGANGVDGIAGTASCASCHSAAHRDPIIASYNGSLHKTGTAVFATNTVFSDGSLNSDRAFCSQCHSQEGYVDNLKYGKPNPKGYDVYQSISCEGCHGNLHRSLNFSTDGNDFGLRQINAVVQKIDPLKFLNASATDGVSTSNTCIACHQSRPDANGFYKRPVIESGEKDFNGAVVINNTTSGPTYRFWSVRTLAKAVSGYPAGTTNYKVYSNTSTGVHDGPQGDIMMGITGIDIAGTTTHLPAAKSAAHYKSNSCVSCHMDAPKADGTAGMHSLKISYVSCIKCHATPETLLTSFQAEFDAKIITLRSALSAKTAYFNTSSTGSVSIKTTFPANISSSTNTTTWDVSTEMPLKYAQAWWNYKLLTSDPGRGVHNPKYVEALIQNSIEGLQ